jgi:SAM-dependent methyltransferase
MLLAVLGAGCSGPGLVPPQAPFVATPDEVGVAMLRLAETTSGDVVYDLGSGDGRVVIAAAREFGARGVGVEIDAALVQQSRDSARRAGVSDRTRFVWQDIFATPVGEATVVTLYLGEALNLRLRPKLLAELRPGARIVSHAFGMAEWRPDRVLDARGPAGQHRLMLWVVPAAVAGRWRASAGGEVGQLVLEQRFSDVEGRLALGADAVAVTGRQDGDQLRLEGAGWTLLGRVAGQRATGTLERAGQAPLALEVERIGH